MPQNYAGRVTLIVVVLLLGLFGIPLLTGGIFTFRPFSGATQEEARKLPLVGLNLKPGIDIAGGTSLIYEIKPPPGGLRGTGQENLAEQVATLLKKRVDPTGTRNLVWRPTGNTRLEIQIPRASMTRDASGNSVKEEYASAKAELVKSNITTAQVVAAVENLTGDARAKALKGLAHGNDQRSALFGQLTSLYDQIKGLENQRAELRKAAKPDEAKIFDLGKQLGEKRFEYKNARERIEQTNVSVDYVQSLIASANPATTGDATPSDADKARQTAAARELAELKAKHPDRMNAIDRLEKVYPKFLAARNSIDDAADLKRQLRGSGVLEFHILVDNPQVEQPEMVRRLEPGGDGPAPQANDQSRWFEVDKPEQFGRGRNVFNWLDKQYTLAWTTPEKSLVHSTGSERDWGLEHAALTHDPQSGRPIVTFQFDSVGGAAFSRLTSGNIGKQLATILDNKIITAPNIRSTIGDRGQIDLGSDSAESEGTYIANTLSAGSLPAQLADEPISERQVGPQLGEANLKAGLQACAVGLVVVALFMMIYYHLAGLVAFVAVVLNLIIILGILGMMGATFTLPGIAGLVLTIGVSVDANVLIFERLREEQMRGLSLKLAVRNAYDRAFTAILDSNVTTAITSAFLIYFGSEEVKGFGLTLLIGILASMFSALFVTKTIFGLMIDKYGLKHLGSLPLTFPRWNQMMHPKVDWMGKVPYFLAFSTLFIALGMFAFIQQARAGKLLDVEFTSGTEVQVNTKEPMTDVEVRERIAKFSSEIPQPAIVAVGDESGNGKYKSFSIVTANADRRQVSDAIFKAMGDTLDVAVPAKFANSGLSVADAIKAGTIQPITLTKNRFLVNGVEVPDAPAYAGGVAIVLDKIEPPLPPGEIDNRINRVLIGEGPNGVLGVPRVARLDNSTSGSDPTRTAVVMFASRNFDYAKNATDWREKLVEPAWRAVNDGIAREASLQKVSNFDAQVATDTQNAAIFATLGSMVAIMIWIWLRFGDHKYGTATVAAMLHDTIMVIGAIGLSHWFAGNVIGNVLGLEAFRVNMTLVAAILTVMGYSMVDTIVVFDRIRENRGKYGTLSRTLINDSINQTLSRTVLTAGTTLMTLFVMYVGGGPAIHGFTFVLLVGIVIGTYSSIAIGAPILLIGVKKAAGTRPPASKTTGATAVSGAVPAQKVGAR